MTLIGALLLSSALAAPAFAQIEEVVVTAQKKSEDIQSVPIAVSAFSSQDLAAHQIEGFKDLQFAIPSVSFTHGNFGPSNFTIRGIGSAAVSTSGDSGVSININQVYLNSPPLTSATYYDVSQIQVLRGPQSTLWGRNATGGAIDIETNKPALDAFAANLEGTYGNFNDEEVRFMANMPIITDQLGVRVAGFWENRDGTVKNIYPGLNPGSGVDSKIDSRDDYSLRGSLRWQPTSKTTLDLLVQTSHENDTRVRGQVQLCDRVPSGILGCLPDKLGFQATNGNATLGTELASNYFLTNTNPLLAPFSLFDITGPGASPGQSAGAIIPHSMTAVNTDFTPVSRGKDFFASAHLEQRLTDWLTASVTLGMDNNSGLSQQSYSNGPGDSLNSAATCTQLFVVSGGLDVTCTPIPGVTRLTAAQGIFAAAFPLNYNAYYAGHVGTLPISQIAGNMNTGIASGRIRDYSGNVQGYDQIDGRDNEWSGELRFTSNFEGPFNFNLGFYHNADRNDAHYYVVANSLDYDAALLGAASVADGFTLFPSQYDNDNERYTLTSNAVFGEIYYNFTDELKLTAGARYTEDRKTFQSGQVLLNSAVPNGTQSFSWISLPPSANASGGCGSAINNPGGLPCYSNQSTTFKEWTGRGVLDWTPKLDFTDETHIYASYSRGVRDGGFNPPPLNPGDFPLTFAPETLNAYEVGTKNTLFDGTMLANLTGWYYDYKGYQVSEIVDRTSINQNINSKLWGVEGEMFWAPVEDLQFNANFGYTHSAIANELDVDPRNPLGNNITANSLLVKDATNGSMCVINGATNPMLNPFLVGAFHLTTPPAPTVINGVTANTAFGYGACTAAGQAAVNGGAFGPGYTAGQGNPVNLKGNQMPLTPPWTVSVGVQYTFHLGGDYTLIPRADYYWTDSQWGRIFEDGADRIKAYDVANAQIQLNAPDNRWYARAWVQNIFDKHNETGEYLTDASSGLFTNVFVGSPRTYGITLGINM
ncbi:MAG: TonB-dependent receptor [Rhizomicrobium sp.]